MKKIIPLIACFFLSACNGSGGSSILYSLSLDILFPNEDVLEDVSINNATFSGAGCPGDDDEYLISADKKVITLLLSDYRAEAGYGTGNTMDRVSCNMAISLNVPTGYRALLLDADFRGNVSLPNKAARAEFKREYFFADGRSPIITDEWQGVLENENIMLTDALAANDGGRLSECGEDVILRSNTSLYIATDENADTAEIAIDSLDFKGRAQFDYYLDYVICD